MTRVSFSVLCMLLLACAACRKPDPVKPDDPVTPDPEPTGVYAEADLDFSEWDNVGSSAIETSRPRGFRCIKYSYNDSYLLGYFEYDVENFGTRNIDSLSVWIDNDDIYYKQGGGAVFSECRCFNLILRGALAKGEERYEWKPTQTLDWEPAGFGAPRKDPIADVAYGLGKVEEGILRFEFAVDRSKTGLSDRSEATIGLLLDGGDFNTLATTPNHAGHIVLFHEVPADRKYEPFHFDKTFYYDYTNFANPERGFYNRRGASFKNDGHPTPPSAESMFQARERTNATLTQFLVYFNQFVEADELPDYVLEYLRESFENHRKAGVKAVVRFGYGDFPPDATIDYVEKHIACLKPVLQEYGDVIYCMEAGFIGNCGEWAGSQNFGGKAADRARLLTALLDAAPSDIQILVRTPGYKKQYLGELWGREYTKRDSISAATAFDGSPNSRLGGHNDCYMATGNDAGTFASNDDRRLWKDDSKYTIMGGETCTIAGYYDYCNCSVAPEKMESQHWSYLNIDYSQDVQNVWRDEGCFDEFVRRMGYRFTMQGVAFEGAFKAGETVKMKLSVANKGYACLMRERKLEFVLVNDADPSDRTVWVSATDPRRWAAGGSYVVEESLKMPSNLSSPGSYTLYLNLPDISPNLHDNPLFSIRMANKQVWNAALGMNAIVHLSSSDSPGGGVGAEDFDKPLDLDFDWEEEQ